MALCLFAAHGMWGSGPLNHNEHRVCTTNFPPCRLAEEEFPNLDNAAHDRERLLAIRLRDERHGCEES